MYIGCTYGSICVHSHTPTLACVSLNWMEVKGTAIDTGLQLGKHLPCPLARLFTSNTFSVIEDDAFIGLSYLQYL